MRSMKEWVLPVLMMLVLSNFFSSLISYLIRDRQFLQHLRWIHPHRLSPFLAYHMFPTRPAVDTIRYYTVYILCLLSYPAVPPSLNLSTGPRVVAPSTNSINKLICRPHPRHQRLTRCKNILYDYVSTKDVIKVQVIEERFVQGAQTRFERLFQGRQ